MFKAVTMRYNWTGQPQDILEEMPILPQDGPSEVKPEEVAANTTNIILKLMENGVCPITRVYTWSQVPDDP